MELFSQTGAYLQGHFRLTSGLHSGEYLQCAKVLAYPQYAEQLGVALAGRLQELAAGRKLNLVISPAMGGIIIGHEVGRALQVKAIFTERDSSSRAMVLRRGFEVGPADQAVVIEDVVTTGGSTREVISSLREAGATVIAVGSIIDRSGGKADVGLPRVSLETLHPETYDPDSCPLCRAAIPLVKPGSRPS